MNERLEELASQLEQISEELSELAIEELKQALRQGGPRTPSVEKRLTQARRAIDKASHLLRAGSEADD